MKKKIVVTSMGVVTPVGIGVRTYWEKLIRGFCGIERISSFDPKELAVQIAGEVRDFNVEDFMPKKLIHETDAFTQYAFASAAEAFSRGLPADKDRVGIVMGTAMAGIDTTAATQEILTNAAHKNVGPRFVPRILANIAAAQISIAYGITGPSYTISTACASGSDAIATGASLLTMGEVDAVLAVGADSTLCPLVIYSLANSQALSRENNDPKHACRPFDKSAKGFVMGEGGGALVLETEEHARERGAQILAELAGWANNTDAYHVTKPDPEGAKASECMRRALEKAGIKPTEIDYINAHGTGTNAGDSAEAMAMEKVFGKCRPFVSSTKASTGHMMGGSGVAEAVACIKAIETGALPPNLNLVNPVADLNFTTVCKSDEGSEKVIKPEIRTVMTNAFGFGGQNSSLVFRKI